MKDNITMDFVKLDFFHLYELYLILKEANFYAQNPEGELKIDTVQALKDVEELQKLPMTSNEASQMLKVINFKYNELSDAFEDDWENPEYTMREETIKNLIAEMKRIASL